jgi:ATP-dependent DNA helicase RecG
VGPELVAVLARLGIVAIQDLWFHLPLRYEDRTRLTPIARLAAGSESQVEGSVLAVERGFRFRPQMRVALVDESRAQLTLRFFHFNRSQAEQFAPGQRLRVFGEVRHGAQGLEMVHPSYRKAAPEQPLESVLTPVYPITEGIRPQRLAQLVERALQRLPADATLDCLPRSLLRGLEPASLVAALRFVHRPPPDADIAALIERRHPAQRRLAFEELVAHNASLKRLRREIQARPAARIDTAGARRRALLAALPFALTGAQIRVLEEIAADLARGRPMLRLVQGDVGSGKTVVAALAALSAIDAGWQAAVMAPTELLAEQHLANFRRWLEPLGVRVQWLAGTVKGRARRAALMALSGSADLVIGTHALMQDAVRFARLGLVVIDEQHRFGVHQRLALRDKGGGDGLVPHQLVMTATPIPRTLAMTAYADLDASVIDELPPGRVPVRTVVISDRRREEVIERIRSACAAGRQAYWVCMLIETSDKLEAQAAEAAHEALRAALPELRLGLVHGRLKSREKQSTMAAFAAGDIQLLVATTVIEVGVDVPNASLMVIENAERLGLSQLHQLRGRIGRGTAASNCVLLYRAPLSPMARARLTVMRESTDGFRIAERDLELRGPGELLGTRQTGQASFRIADLARDGALLPDVAAAAERLLAAEPVIADRLIRRWIGAAARYAEA